MKEVSPFIAKMPVLLPDESLFGYIDRAAQRTMLRDLRGFYRLAGSRKAAIVPRLFSIDEDQARGIAELFKLEMSDVVSHLHPWGKAKATIEFFGTTIRFQYFETAIRRVSPRALSISPHYRAIWDLRTFGFDPDTRERLMDRCPECGKRLGWKRLAGPVTCEHCLYDDDKATDLRAFPQPILELEDEEAIEFAVGLIHPDRARRDIVHKLLPEELRSASAADLFDSVISIASILRPSNVNRVAAVGRPKDLKQFEELTPELLTMGVRAIIGGEDGFGAVADRMRSSMESRPAALGLFKEIGPLAATAGTTTTSPVIREFFRLAIKRDLARVTDLGLVRKRSAAVPTDVDDWRNVKELYKEFRIQSTDITRLAVSGLIESRRVGESGHTPIMIRREDFAPIAAKHKDAIHECYAAARLGVTYGELADLARRKIIDRVEGPAAVLLGDGIFYAGSSIASVLAAIDQRADRPNPAGRSLSLNDAAREFAPDIPWAAIIAMILSGEISIRRRRRKGKNWQDAVAADDLEGFRKLVAAAATNRGDANPTENWLNSSDAAVLLGCRIHTVPILREIGQLPNSRRGRSWFHQRAELEAFRRKYVFGREVLAKSIFKINHQLYAWLRSRKILPKLKIESDPVFDRAELERALQSMPTRPPETERKRSRGYRFTIAEKQRMVDAVRSGLSVRIVSRDMGGNAKNIARWVEEFEATGAISSDWKLERHQDALAAIIDADPKQTVKSVWRHVVAGGVEISITSLNDYLKRIGYRRNNRGELRRRRSAAGVALPGGHPEGTAG